MALGIVRAADQGAIWRTAAEFTPAEEPPTSEPPSGATPTSQAGPPPEVVIPNSNKFKTPANGLKKVLDDGIDKINYAQGQHPGVAAWLSKPNNAAFAKTYFSPDYAPAIKAHLGKDKYGNELYDKLLYHLPEEHHQALTTHAQKATPNSNKFKTPANGLKKLLDSPDTTTAHVKAWMDSHQGFQTYLHPSYEQALKGHLGEKNYAELKKHLQAPTPPTEQAQALEDANTKGLQPKDKQKQVKQDITDAMAPAGFKPITQEQALATPGEVKEPTVGEKIHAIYPQMGPSVQQLDEKLSQKSPEEIKNLFEVTQKSHPDLAQGLQKIYDEHFGQKPDLSFGKKLQKLLQDSHAEGYVDNAAAKAWDKKDPKGLKDLYDNLLKYNPEQADDIKKIFQEHHGFPVPGAPEDQDEISKIQELMAPGGQDEAAKHQALAAGIKKIFPNTKLDLDKMTVPQLQRQMLNWKDHLDHPDYQPYHSQLKSLYDQHFGQGEPQMAPEKSQAQSGEYDKDALTKDLQGVFSNPNFFKALDKAQSPAAAQALLTKKMHDFNAAGMPGGAEKLQAVYDKHFGQGTTQQQPDEEPLQDWEQELMDQAQAPPEGPAKGTPSDGQSKLTMDMLKQYWPQGKEDILKDHLKDDPAEQKAYIESVLSKFGTSSHPNKAKWQEIYDKLYGQQPESTPFMTWLKGKAPDAATNWDKLSPTSQNNWAWKFDQFKGQPDDDESQFQQWAQSVAEDPEHTSHGQSMEDLHKAWDSSSPEDKADALNYAKSDYYKQYKQEHPPGLKGDVDNTPDLHDEGFLDYVSKTYDDHPDYMTPHAIQQAWNGYTGHEPSAQAAPSFDPKALAKELSDHFGIGEITGNGKKWSDKSAAEAKENLQDWSTSSALSPDDNAKAKELLDKYFGGTPQRPGAQPDQATVVSDIDAALGGGYQADWDSLSPEEIHTKLQSTIKGLKTPTGGPITDGKNKNTARLLENVLHKHWPDAPTGDPESVGKSPTAQGGGFQKPSDGEIDQLAAGGKISTQAAGILKNLPPEKFQENLQWAKDNPGNNSTWDAIAQYVGASADKSQSFDAAQAAKEYGLAIGLGELSAPNVHGSGGTYKSLDYDTFKAQLAKMLQTAKDGGLNHQHADKIQQVYDKYFGNDAAASSQAAPPAMSLQDMHDAVHKIFPNFYDVDSPEALKAKLTSWLDKGFSAETKAKAQKLLDELFGPNAGAAGPNEAPPFNHEAIWADWAGIYPHSISKDKFATPEAAKHYLQANLAASTEKAHHAEIAAMLDKWFPESGAATTPAFDPQAFHADYQEIFPASAYSPSNWTSPEKASQKLDQLIADKTTFGATGLVDKLKALKDKYFGAGSGPQPLDKDAIKKEFAAIWGFSSNSVTAGELNAALNSGDPNQVKAAIQKKLDSWASSDNPKKVTVVPALQALLDKHFGQGTVQPAAHPAFIDKDQMVKEWLQIWPGDEGSSYHDAISGGDPEKIKAKIQDGLESGYWPSSKQQAVQKLYDKYFGTGAPKAGFTLGVDTLTKEQVIAAGLSPEMASVLADNTPEQIKAKYEWAGNHPGESGTWDKVKAWIDSQQGGAAPPAKTAPWDWNTFGQEWMGLFPKSDWGTSIHTFEDAKAKLKGALQQAQSSYPGTDKTKQTEALYKKYFGDPGAAPTGAAPSGGGAAAFDPVALANEVGAITGLGPDVNSSGVPYKTMTPEQAKASLQNAIDNNGYGNADVQEYQKLYDKYFGGGDGSFAPEVIPEEPEEEEGVSAPFKTEQPTDEDLAHFSGAKPTNNAGFKEFANWWGKTQLTPEQEQGLYKSWFGKDVPAEHANTWFGKVFENYSKPGSGDLGVEGIPAWAHNSWALGKNADKEWPTFKAWASADPGIPKGLGVKQKLAIWNSLSAGDKKEIADNYAPANPIDKKALLTELQGAYPDSDWSDWAKMGQGSLKNNLEVLAKSGYAPIIPLYNSYFGANIPEIKADPKKKATKPKSTLAYKVLPASKIPSWVEESYQGFGTGDKAASQYSAFKHWADTMGLSEMAETGKDPTVSAGSYYSKYPYKLLKKWNLLPDYIKNQVGHMAQVPWTNEESFEAWKDAQATPASEVMAATGKGLDQLSYYWSQPPTGSYFKYQGQALGSMIDQEPDPQKKQALLGIYHKYWGAGKPTLGQSLKAIYPQEDWDKFLQTKDTTSLQKELKKRLKTEKDPEKWIALVDAWGTYFPGTASGHKQVTAALKGHSTGAVGADLLKKLKFWKEKMGAPTDTNINYLYSGSGPMQEYEPGNYIKGQDNKPSGIAPYHGWTPEGDDVAEIGQIDPALMASPGPTYAAPEQTKGSKQYQTLTETLKKHQAAFSTSERNMIGSEEFQNWFSASPKAYKDVFQHNPGIALDDFKAFMAGSSFYSDTPEGGGTKKKYDLSPYWLAPYTKGQDSSTVYFGPNNPVKVDSDLFPAPAGSHGDPGHWPGFTKNPKSTDSARPSTPWTEKDDPTGQFSIPLPPGESFEPAHQLEELHRGSNLDLSIEPGNPPPEHWKKDNPKEYQAQMKRYHQRQVMKDLADQIRARILGSSYTGWKDLFNTAPASAPYVEPPKGKWGAYGPSSAEQSLAFNKWVQDNNVGKEQLYNMAKKWNVSKPEEYGIPGMDQFPGTGHSSPKYVHIPGLPDSPNQDAQHPVQMDKELANMILDYATLHGKYDQEGLGDHWSKKFQVSNQSFSSQAAPNDLSSLPVIVSGYWNGLGEHPGRPDAAWGYGSEYEINLAPGAPVQVHTVQVRLPGHGDQLFKLPVEPHLRYASLQRPAVSKLSMADVEESIAILASWAEDDEDEFPPGLEDTDPKFWSRPKYNPHEFGWGEKRYYSPRQVNPEAPGGDRPHTEWRGQDPPQEPLPGMGWKDREPRDLYRGYMLDLRQDDLAHIRRALLGQEGEDPDVVRPLLKNKGLFDSPEAKANPKGYDNPELGKVLLDYLSKAKFMSPGGMGTHWTTDEGVAHTFSGTASTPWHLPVKVRAQWKGVGEDPYRSSTGGSFPDENEITMLPTANMDIKSVQIRHPKFRAWHEVLPQGDEPEVREATVRPRRGAILTHTEMRR